LKLFESMVLLSWST